MESYIIAYIAQRMVNLGFTKYSFEPLLIILPQDKNEYQVDGTNEYYYLVSKFLATGTEISSGNNYFKADDGYTSLDFFKIQEFTGQIKVVSPQGVKQIIEFIRVIPMYQQP
jgi:hypothetical protein